MSDSGVLSILGVTANEDANTRLLRYAIETEPAFRDEFLKRVLGWDPPGPDAKIVARDQVVVRVEKRGRRLDLAIAVADKGRTKFAIVENKLQSGEGDDQTVDYAHPDTTLSLTKELRQSVSDSVFDREPTRVFLVLQPQEKARAPEFTTVRHKVVSDAIAACEAHLTSQTVRSLLLEWRIHVEAFEQAITNVDLSKPLPFLFPDESELGTGYGVFCKISGSIADSLRHRVKGEVQHWTYRGAGQGRSWFGVQIWAPGWIADASDTTLNRSVHFQVSWNPLDRVMNITAHYETNPYRPQNQAEDQFPDTIESYIRERARVTSLMLEALGAQGWLKSGSWNTFAKLKSAGSVESRSAAVLIDEISDRLAAAWRVVDRIIASPNPPVGRSDR